MARPRKAPGDRAGQQSFTLYASDQAILSKLGGHNKSQVLRDLLRATINGPGARVVELEAEKAALQAEIEALKLDLEHAKSRLEAHVSPLKANATLLDRVMHRLAEEFPTFGNPGRIVIGKQIAGLLQMQRIGGTSWAQWVMATGSESAAHETLERLQAEFQRPQNGMVVP